jgi:hypothetical protein
MTYGELPMSGFDEEVEEIFCNHSTKKTGVSPDSEGLPACPVPDASTTNEPGRRVSSYEHDTTWKIVDMRELDMHAPVCVKTKRGGQPQGFRYATDANTVDGTSLQTIVRDYYHGVVAIKPETLNDGVYDAAVTALSREYKYVALIRTEEGCGVWRTYGRYLPDATVNEVTANNSFCEYGLDYRPFGTGIGIKHNTKGGSECPVNRVDGQTEEDDFDTWMIYDMTDPKWAPLAPQSKCDCAGSSNCAENAAYGNCGGIGLACGARVKHSVNGPGYVVRNGDYPAAAALTLPTFFHTHAYTPPTSHHSRPRPPPPGRLLL